MAHRILIVDDDQEFNVLLTDVFSQADYEVETCGDVSSALERLAAGGIDLLVTDFRMPGPSGLDLVRRVRELQRELPIIMVSGYLDNGMIRDLIRLGVGGIFMKPLNIFSLLKKTGELIEREEQRESEEAPVEASGFGANVGYRFRAFPCRDACSRDFAKRLFEMRNFAKNLLLIAESGTDLRTLAEDLAAAGDLCRTLALPGAGEFDEAYALQALQGAAGAELGGGVTFVFERAERLTGEQRALIYEIARHKGAFAEPGAPRRFLFCLDRELDDYYDEGLIDEEFYLFLGTSELKAPGLAEIPEDIPVMADAILARDFPGKELENAARTFLQRHPWKGNVEALSERLRQVARLTTGSTIEVELLRAVLEGTLPVSAPEAIAPDASSPLEAFLQQRRSAYLAAYEQLFGCPLQSATAKKPLSSLA